MFFNSMTLLILRLGYKQLQNNQNSHPLGVKLNPNSMDNHHPIVTSSRSLRAEYVTLMITIVLGKKQYNLIFIDRQAFT